MSDGELRAACDRSDGAFRPSGYSDRICSPGETLDRVLPLLKDYGITRLSRLTGLDCIGIPVWNAVVPNSRSIVINQGKGITDLDAKVSAAMEALERSVGCMPDIFVVTAARRDLLREGRAVDTLPSLIASRESDVGDDDVLRWALGLDLMTGRDTYVPYEAAILDLTVENCRYWQSSDGLASGNTKTEAIFHGLLERIERDADILSRVSPVAERRGRCVAPESLNDPVLAGLCERIEAAGLLLRLFDITSDIGIACFSAYIAPLDIASMKHPRFIDVTHGSGAHPNAPRAAIRAVTEAAQSRLTYISGARDDVYPQTYLRPLPPELRQFLLVEPVEYGGDAGDPDCGLDDLLAATLEKLRRVNVSSVVALPLSGPDLPFCVVKIFVPQLENPDGPRKRRFGARAISRVLRAA